MEQQGQGGIVFIFLLGSIHDIVQFQVLRVIRGNGGIILVGKMGRVQFLDDLHALQFQGGQLNVVTTGTTSTIDGSHTTDTTGTLPRIMKTIATHRIHHTFGTVGDHLVGEHGLAGKGRRDQDHDFGWANA